MLQESTAHDLVGEVTGRATTAWFKVTGDSMYPFLVSGQKIQIETKPPEELIPGDIIAFRRNSRICSHRILKKEKRGNRDYFLTKGDANLFWDALLTETADNPILGKVIAVCRKEQPTPISYEMRGFIGRKTISLSWLTGFVFTKATEKKYHFPPKRECLILVAKILRRFTILVSRLNVYISESNAVPQ